MDLQTLVRIYAKKNRPKLDGLLQGFRNLQSLEQTVRVAALGLTPDGKRHPHQRRVARSALAQAKDILLSALGEIGACPSFEDLFSLVTTRTGLVKGFGKLAQYDTALRIGAFRGIYPQRAYLHAGARVGAGALGFSKRRDALEVSELPQPLPRLAPHEIEDFLCIYKVELKRIRLPKSLMNRTVSLGSLTRPGGAAGGGKAKVHPLEGPVSRRFPVAP
jgi:hypothetical protein